MLNYEAVQKVNKMEKIFAGFWRDGAKVEPEEKHWSCCKCIFAIQKHNKSLDICLRNFDEWEAVYWLDTTTPTELTPQEAFELLKVVYPSLKGIQEDEFHGAILDCGGETCINWGDTTEYPPKQRWRVPTDADKGKECRCKHRHDGEWKYDRIFITEFEGKYLAKDLADNSHRKYAMCEVLDE